MYSDSGSTSSPTLTISASSGALASASSKVGSSSCSPLTKTTSAFSITAAICGGGSKVWLLVPSGTTPVIVARSPAMFATMLVIGATVDTTCSVPPSAESAGLLSSAEPQAVVVSARASRVPAARVQGVMRPA